jgi:hypothetical protein
MDMRSLQAFLKAIDAQSGKKASHKNKAGAKRPSSGATKQAPKEVHFERSCELCKKHGGAILSALPKISAGTTKMEW